MLLAGNVVLLALWTLGCIIALLPILISAGALATVVWVLVRRPHLAVTAYDDELVIRNWGGGLTIPRSEIAEFRIDTPSIGTALRTNSVVSPAVHAVRHDGTVVALKPTAMKFPDASLDENLQLLCGWLGGNGAE